MLPVVLRQIDQRHGDANGLDHRVTQRLRAAHGGNHAAVMVLIRAVIQQLHSLLRPKGPRNFFHLFKIPSLAEIRDALHDLIHRVSLLYPSRFSGPRSRVPLFIHNICTIAKKMPPRNRFSSPAFTFRPFFTVRPLFLTRIQREAPIIVFVRPRSGGRFCPLMRCLGSELSQYRFNLVITTKFFI
ncbi:hypothetical protein SDC9_113598 [bioreactor metagenome]|uniref:Uncharacterized protein n=1 Tax=bioreactor metagenome TaxID=1076179 RepID=A0A645BNK2_9ZZZZ